MIVSNARMKNKHLKILLMEDDKLDQNAFKRTIAGLKPHCDCTCVATLAEAKQCLATEPFDLMVSDYSVPDGTGLDLLQFIKDIPVIMATGHGSEETAIKALQMGAKDYLVKDPDRFYLKLLPSVIEKVMQQTHQEKEIVRLAAIVSSTEEAIMSGTIDGIVTTWNRGAERIYGYTAEEIVGKSIIATVPADMRAGFTEHLMKIKNGEPVTHFETVRIRKDKTVVDVSIAFSAIHNEDGTVAGFSAIIRDITEEKHLERLKDDFLAIVSHELRTPLTIFKGNLENLIDEIAGPVTLQQKEILETLNRNTDRLAHIITNMLELSRLESGSAITNWVPITLGKTIEESLESFQGEIQKKGIRVEVIISPSCPGIQSDAGMLDEVFTNLLGNSIRYAKAKLTITVEDDPGSHCVKVGITDDGGGIPSNRIPDLFNKFVQVKRSSGGSYRGTGLGLAICKEIIDIHRGKIWVESEEGKGTSFFFTIPTRPEICVNSLPEV